MGPVTKPLTIIAEEEGIQQLKPNHKNEATTKNKSKTNDEDEEEEDEDYVPGNDDAAASDSDQDGGGDTTAIVHDQEEGTTAESRLTPAQRLAVEEAFVSLFGTNRSAFVVPPPPHCNNDHTNDGGTTDTSSEETDYYYRSYSRKKRRNNKKASSPWKQKVRILTNVFGGRSIATKVITTARESVERYGASCLAGRKRKVDSSLMDYSEETKTIREQKRFAGSIVEVERVVRLSALDSSSSGGAVKKEEEKKKENSNRTDSSSSSSSDVNNTTSSNPIPAIPLPKPQGIDSLLDQIASGPQTISTVQKTDADWELFKDRTGLEDELAKKAKGKDAFLVKKDFLNRVDQRKFELEKVERERERRRAAASSGK